MPKYPIQMDIIDKKHFHVSIILICQRKKKKELKTIFSLGKIFWNKYLPVRSGMLGEKLHVGQCIFEPLWTLIKN